jgi:hypothetical protein
MFPLGDVLESEQWANGDTMSESETEVQAEPRWKIAGEPYLLTRDELLAELREWAPGVTERQLRSWTSYGLLPPTTRNVPIGANDGVARALYPVWVIGLVRALWRTIRWKQQTIEEIKPIAPMLWKQWAKREHVFISDRVTQEPDPILEKRLNDALQQAVADYTEYVSKTTGRLVTHATLDLHQEDATSQVIAFRPYKPG